MLQLQGSTLAAVTVHRVGPAEETTHRTDLGRVLVTIDDLAALMTFLTRSMVGTAAKIKVEFDGGYFTEPEELRTLSDMEMRSLRLKSPKVEVVLSPSAAFAVGERQEAEDVYRIWARARQTQRRSRRLRLADNSGFILIVLLGLAGFSTIITRLLRDHPTVTLDTLAVMFGLFIVGSWYIWRWQRENALSYALIVPSSLDEYRQTRSNQTYPRRSWIVATVSVVIAAISVTVAIWFGVHR